MRRELMEELEADTTLEDIAEPYRLVVEMIGLWSERQGTGQGVRPDHQPDITDCTGPGPDTNQPV